jgi:N-acyl-D-amino-acid deacylase
MLLADPQHMPKVHQGVTTELVGIDGNSYAPFRSPDDLERFIDLNSGLDGRPELPGTWATVSDYLGLFDRKVAVNVVYIVGNSPLRIAAAGWTDRGATRDEIENMKAVLRESMEEGAVGMSTGLDYPPGSFADTDELVELSAEAASLGGIYHTHVRYSLGDRYLDPFKEAIEIGRRSGVPVHVTHMFRRPTNPGGSGPIIELVEEARNEDLDVTFDCFPYPYGGTRATIVLPQWVQDGGPDGLRDALRSPEARERLRTEAIPRGRGWDEMWLTYFSRPDNLKYEGWSLAAISDDLGKHPVDTLCDLLLDEDLQVSYFAANVDPATISDFVAHPLQMVGSDALLIGDYPVPMAYGTYPLILSEIVREERKLSLPDAIRKMTFYPAQRLGISDRGLVRDGYKADLVMFDADAIKANATRQKPRQLSEGVEYVIVNGELVIDRGSHTGATPGRALGRRR